VDLRLAEEYLKLQAPSRKLQAAIKKTQLNNRIKK